MANENGPLLSCSPFMDLVPKTDLVTPMIGALDPSLPPIDPSGCSFQDVVIPSDEDLLEAMTSLDIPSVMLLWSFLMITWLDWTILQLNPPPIFLLRFISPLVDPETVALTSLLALSLSCKLVSLMSLMSHINVQTLSMMSFFL